MRELKSASKNIEAKFNKVNDEATQIIRHCTECEYFGISICTYDDLEQADSYPTFAFACSKNENLLYLNTINIKKCIVR